MARGFRPLAASVIRRVEAGVTFGAQGLIRPRLKPTPGAPQDIAQLTSSHPGGVAWSHPRGRLERIQDPNLARARALDGPSTISQ